MKNCVKLLMALMVATGLSFSTQSKASTKNENKKATSKKAAQGPTSKNSDDKRSGKSSTGKKIGRNFDFDDMLVKGKYLYPEDATATVEDEKLLGDLLEFRKDYKDRLEQSSMRQ